MPWPLTKIGPLPDDLYTDQEEKVEVKVRIDNYEVPKTPRIECDSHSYDPEKDPFLNFF